jgi:gamma-glutamyl hercynylcysteine S-oxide synthase
VPTSEAPTSNMLEQLQSARAESDRFFDIIARAAMHERPIDARHRIIFYVGHLDGFDSIQICREGLGIKSMDQPLDDLFQAGIDPDSQHLPADTPSDWPSLDQVSSYVTRCRRKVDNYLERAPSEVVQMSLEHRLMHLETLAYMFHNLSYEAKNAPRTSSAVESGQLLGENEWRSIPGGDTVLGKRQDECFGWDNEFQEMQCSVPEFRIQRFSVTNGDYLRFVQDGAPLPHFWMLRGGALHYRGMFEEFPLPLDCPVYVTMYEAEAYACWSGKSLPTEAQFHRAAFGTPGGKEKKFPWGDAEPGPGVEYGNFDFARWEPESVYAKSAGDSSFGVSQLVGNGWQWTSTLFAPFPGFKPRSTYPGYSANFFDGEHFVLKGGSPRTAARLLRRSFRNWFRRDYPFVYATFRCVEN